MKSVSNDSNLVFIVEDSSFFCNCYVMTIKHKDKYFVKLGSTDHVTFFKARKLPDIVV